MNEAYLHSRGVFLVRMDADDVSNRNRFEREMEVFKEYPLVDIVSSNIIYINSVGEYIGEKGKIPTQDRKIKRLLRIGSPIINPTIIMRRKVLQTVGGYNELNLSEDLDLWFRIMNAKFKFKSLDVSLLKYRIRDNSMSSNYWRNHLYTKVIINFYKISSQNIITSSEVSKILNNGVKKMGLLYNSLQRKFNLNMKKRLGGIRLLRKKIF